MNNALFCLKSDWKKMSLYAFAGTVVATVVVVLLVADKLGGLQLAWWQIAAIYFAAIAGGVSLALKGCGKTSAGSDAKDAAQSASA